MRHSRFIVATALIPAFVGLADGIIAIVITVEQASDGLLPVRGLCCLGESGGAGSKRQADKYGCKVAHDPSSSVC